MVCYDDFAKTFSESRKHLHWPEIDAILDDMQAVNARRILDVGCGNGRLVQAMQARGMSTRAYVGVDASKNMIQEARGLHPDEVFLVGSMETLGDMPNLPYKQFDAIVFLASFHHLKNVSTRLSVLLAAKSLLHPQGRVYLTNWNLCGQERYASSHQGDGDFLIKIGSSMRYYHGFRLEELENLFIQTGYTIHTHTLFP